MANKRERLGFARTLSAARELYAHTLVDVLAQVEHGQGRQPGQGRAHRRHQVGVHPQHLGGVSRG